MIALFFWGIIALLCLPLVVILASTATVDVAIWSHLIDTVLVDYIKNSVMLALGVGFGTLLLGVPSAFLLARYDFFGRKALTWLSILPLAFPAYIIAYTYTGLLDFAGPVQTLLRDLTGWQYGDYTFWNIRSLSGAIVMLSLVLYPYVLLLSRNAFREQSPRLEEVSSSLGVQRFRHIFSIALPIARPAMATGCALAMMEALADFGTVQYFGVSTFTTGIFRTWFGMGSSATALQLSGLLCTLVLVCVLLEQYSRRKHAAFQQNRLPYQAKRLRGWRAVVAVLVCGLPPLLGFIVPLIVLASWSWTYRNDWQLSEFIPLLTSSFVLALLAALITASIAVFLAYSQRWSRPNRVAWPLSLASMGYALPGVVVAVGVMQPFGWFDRTLNSFTQAWFDYLPGLILSGTIVALLFGYLVRFMAVAMHSIQTGLERVSPAMDETAVALGAGRWRLFRAVHLPLIRTSLLTAVLLVFVDVLKELPATLVLRPFNVNTLAVKTYELASDERLMQASLPAICIVLTGLIPVLLLNRTLEKRSTTHA